MEKTRGFVIAFHNDEHNPYHGLTCKDRAIRKLKPYIPYDVLSRLRQVAESKVEFDKVRGRISLESGIVQGDGEVLVFVDRKVGEGESIFLDLTVEDALRHNKSELANLFVIASVFVNQETFRLMNPELFTQEEKSNIVAIVHESQDGVLEEVETPPATFVSVL